MQYHNLLNRILRLYPAWVFLLATLIAIHSCKKDNKTQTLADPVLNQAKQWYDAAYPSPVVRAVIPVNRAASPTANSLFDYTKHIKPDWQHAAKYNRYNAGIIEMPLDPSSDKISSGFKNVPGKTLFPQQYSRSSFLLLNQGGQYHAYVMTIIGDSAYIHNDPGKLALTSYRKRDPGFSGVVAYFTPNGRFVASFGYKNGKLVPAPVEAAAQGPAVAVNTKSTARFHSTTREISTNECLAWYLDTYIDGELVSEQFLYITCPSDASPAPSSGTSPPTQPLCPSAGTSPPPAGAVTQHSPIKVRVAQPSPTPIGDDGGLPPPPTETQQTCPVPVVDSTAAAADTTKDPCAQAATLAANQKFKSAMDSLSSKLSQPSEYAYRINDNNGNPTYDLFSGGPSGLNFNFTTSFFNNTDGLIHSHEINDSNLPIFSLYDMQALYLAVSSGQVHSPSTFIFGLVTPSGSYLLSIKNLSKFLQVGSNELGIDLTKPSLLANIYNSLVKSSNTAAQNEAGFATFLNTLDGGSGLTLMKSNATLSTWATVGIDANNLVTYINCN